jgi:hypothetical protein
MEVRARGGGIMARKGAETGGRARDAHLSVRCYREEKEAVWAALRILNEGAVPGLRKMDDSDFVRWAVREKLAALGVEVADRVPAKSA